MSINKIYKPFNFSDLGVYVLKIKITHTGATKIEDTLPSHIRVLKGIYFTSNPNSTEKVTGYITLNFNEGILKNVQLPVMNSNVITHHSHPIPINETVKSNSIMQGYFYANNAIKIPYTVSVYLHYER